jgi:excisionase family DNA binding protein
MANPRKGFGMSTAAVADEAPRYVSIDDTAARLGLHYNTVYRMVRSGELPAILIHRRWRIREDHLEALLAGEP